MAQIVPGVVCVLLVGLGKHPFVHLGQGKRCFFNGIVAHLDIFTRSLTVWMVGFCSVLCATQEPRAGLTRQRCWELGVRSAMIRDKARTGGLSSTQISGLHKLTITTLNQPGAMHQEVLGILGRSTLRFHDAGCETRQQPFNRSLASTGVTLSRVPDGPPGFRIVESELSPPAEFGPTRSKIGPLLSHPQSRQTFSRPSRHLLFIN